MITSISVSLVYAERDQQWLFEAEVPRGTNASELIKQSNFLQQIESLQRRDIESLELAVYAQAIRADHLLEEGDRVEILRPLTADPKTVRREMAKLGKTMTNR